MDTRQIEKKIVEIMEEWERECDQFFTFPKRFPAGCRDAYLEVLWHLLAELRFRPNFQLAWVRKAVDEHKQFMTDLHSGRDIDMQDKVLEKLPFVFEPLEGKLITMLARYEYAAGLPTRECLEFIADKNTVHGYVIQEQRSAKGKQSGVVRRMNQKSRDAKIVAYARTLRTRGVDRNQWASNASRKYGVSIPTARKAIKAAGLYNYLSSLQQKKVTRKRAIRS